MLAEPTDGTVEGNYNYIYRMKAVDAAALLDAQLQELDPELRRPAGKSFRQHLTELREGPGAPLKSAKLSLCNSFADSYEHARHGQKPFGEAEYRKYVATLNNLLTCIKNKIYRKKSHVTFQNVAQVYSNSTSSHQIRPSVQEDHFTLVSRLAFLGGFDDTDNYLATRNGDCK
ncbi:hypothetical protein Bbelb_443600 [Branchiostoma belcheri]|nr:hypothetical protein Bbelb_443600 [Branchiostoma belcheri]